MAQPPAEIESSLLDLTGITLQELRSYDRRTLDPAVERLVRRLKELTVSAAGTTPPPAS